MKDLISLSTVLACTVSVCFATYAMIHAPDNIKIDDSFEIKCMGHNDNASIKLTDVEYQLTKDGQWFYDYKFAGNATDKHEAHGIDRTQIEATSADPGHVLIKNATNATVGEYVCIFFYKLDDGETQHDNDTKYVALHTDPPHKGDASLHTFSFACIAIVMLKFFL